MPDGGGASMDHPHAPSIETRASWLAAGAAAYRFGFSGIIPAYVVATRDLFPSAEASWRIPLVLFTGMGGMAFGGWFAGRLYDQFGFYAPAFGSGVAFNVLNLILIGFLVLRQAGPGQAASTRLLLG